MKLYIKKYFYSINGYCIEKAGLLQALPVKVRLNFHASVKLFLCSFYL